MNQRINETIQNPKIAGFFFAKYGLHILTDTSDTLFMFLQGNPPN